MTLQDEIRQMVTASRLYYENNRTQAEIAQDLGISRPTVSRLLQRAIDEGIVHIQISDPFANNEELAAGLCIATGLEKAIVVPGESTRAEIVRHRIALAAARYLGETLTSNDILGIGWGRTLYEVSMALEPKSISGLLAVPLLGGLGQVDHSFQVHEITSRISNAFGGTWQQFYFPGIVKDNEALKSISDSVDMKRVVSTWKRMTIAVVGIANVDFDSGMKLLFTDYLDDPDRKRLAKKGAVGDIVMHFFDLQGRPIPYDTLEVISIELEQLCVTPRVVAVAGGKDKAHAILGAINGRYIKVLVTDELTAGEIITLAKTQAKA